MSSGNENEIEARFAFHGLILRCPFGGNPPDCPLHIVRMLPVEERVQWLEAQTDGELNVLYEAHDECMEYKLTHYDLEKPP